MAHKQSDPGCELCYSSDLENNQIITATLIALRALKDEVREPEDPKQQYGGFNGLLKQLFGSKYKNFKETMKCSHLHLRNKFESAMEISGRELNELSNVKMCQKAKYLYHVDVVGAQVKTYHRHFSDLLSKSQKVKSLNKSPGGTEKTISPPKPPQFTAPLLPDPKQPPVKQEEPDGAPPLAFSPEPPQLRYSSGVQFGGQFPHVFTGGFIFDFGQFSPSQPE